MDEIWIFNANNSQYWSPIGKYFIRTFKNLTGLQTCYRPDTRQVRQQRLLWPEFWRLEMTKNYWYKNLKKKGSCMKVLFTNIWFGTPGSTVWSIWGLLGVFCLTTVIWMKCLVWTKSGLPLSSEAMWHWWGQHGLEPTCCSGWRGEGVRGGQSLYSCCSSRQRPRLLQGHRARSTRTSTK